MRVAVFGGSGYAGGELLRLLAAHPNFEFGGASGEGAAERPIAEHDPSLAAAYPDARFHTHESLLAQAIDVAFFALPHDHAVPLAERAAARGAVVVDLGSSLRLRDATQHAQWYGSAPAETALRDRAVSGLVERHRASLGGATVIAVPGCFPTATALALGPFADAGWLSGDTVIVNGLSGTSGAGRGLREDLQFSDRFGNANAYGVLHHRHTAEMESELGRPVLFTPHLVPVSRGLLITAYARLSGPRRTPEGLELLRSAYRDDPFVVVTTEPPGLKDPLGSNLAFVSVAADERTGWLLAMASIDNLGKGAAGQAIQAANVALGLDERAGLPTVGVAH